MEPISLRAYAKHRAAHGLSGNAMAVSLAVKAGRLSKSVTYVNGQPKITDPALADQEWERNTDTQRRINAAGGVDPNVQRTPTIDSPPAAAIEDVATATERLKGAQADLAELKRDEARGELVPARDVERRLVEVFTACKTRLMAIPSRYRQQIPHLTADEVGHLERLVREALDDLAEARE
jgi:hypothetical protein